MYLIVGKIVKLLLNLKETHEGQFADTRENVQHIKHILYDMEIIDGKSSALLTHVSVMLAVVVGILFTISNEPGWFSIILKFEIVFYAVVALCLLRCVEVMGPPFRRISGKTELINIEYQKEILIRRAIYQLMVRLVFIFTLILIVAMIIEFLWL